ncbi:hypothetical protein M422DRAFT_43368 [Sphaerobolus stellatus SS14]|nr:hypothetical protein M422DRAFT_43368 [Sphaerobolus stellatus SS14]
MQTLSISLTPGSFQVQSPTSATLRTRESHQAFKRPSPRSTAMTRKASLSSLIDTAASAAMPLNSLQSPTTYAAPTAASRARSQAIQAQFHTHSAAQTPRPSYSSYNTKHKLVV